MSNAWIRGNLYHHNRAGGVFFIRQSAVPVIYFPSCITRVLEYHRRWQINNEASEILMHAAAHQHKLFECESDISQATADLQTRNILLHLSIEMLADSKQVLQ